MANYRTTKLFAQKSYTADATELIDINLADPISRILVEFEGQNTGSTSTSGHPAKGIKKIELSDGSDILLSMDGLEAYAMQFFNTKKVPSDWLPFLNDMWFHVTFKLDFGRYLWDPELALDPKQFNNLQLKIETDQDAGGVAPDNSKLQVMASVFDEKAISPFGMLVSKRIKQYTMGSASHEYTDLPTDQKIRKLIIKALVAGTEPGSIMNNIKLSEDNDKRVVFDLNWFELIRMYTDENLEYLEGFYAASTTSQTTIHCTPTERTQGVLNAWAEAAGGYHTFYDGDGGRMKLIGSAANNVNGLVKGFSPNGCLSIPMGNEMDPDDWFDPMGLRNLRLDLLSQAAGSTYAAEILLQQLRPY